MTDALARVALLGLGRPGVRALAGLMLRARGGWSKERDGVVSCMIFCGREKKYLRLQPGNCSKALGFHTRLRYDCCRTDQERGGISDEVRRDEERGVDRNVP